MAVLREKMFTFAKLLRTPCLSFPESMLKKIHSSPAKLRKIIHHGSLLDSFVSTQLASGNPFSGQIVADWILFLHSLLGHALQMHFDFRPLLRRTFAALSRNFREKYYPQARPQPSAQAHQRKSKHQGPLCFAIAKPHFWKLGCCVWSFRTMVVRCGEPSPLEAPLLLSRNFREKNYCRELTKNFREGSQHDMLCLRN